MLDQEFTRRLRDTKPEWRENPDGGFVTELNGVPIYIDGGDFLPITLKLLDGFVWRDVIYQPRMHISETPWGRFMKWAATILNLPEQNGPETPEAKADEEVRKNLEAILESAQTQFQERVKNAGGYEDYCRKAKHELYVQAIFGKDAFK